MIFILKLQIDWNQRLNISKNIGGRCSLPSQTRSTPHPEIDAVSFRRGCFGAEPAVWVEFQGTGEERGIQVHETCCHA